MLQCEVLIRKAASVDGFPSCAIVVGEVTCLRAEHLLSGRPLGLAGVGRAPLHCWDAAPNPPKAHPDSNNSGKKVKKKKQPNDIGTNTIWKINKNKIKLKYFLLQ